MTTPPPAEPAPERVCRCHQSHVYASLLRCPRCGHRSLDPGIGCERRKCGYEEPEDD